MKNFVYRLTRIEGHLEKLNREKGTDVRDMFKTMSEHEASLYEKTNNTFLRHFGYRLYQNDIQDIPENATFEKRNEILVKNFTKIMIHFIISKHRVDLGDSDQNNFFIQARKYDELDIFFQILEDHERRRDENS